MNSEQEEVKGWWLADLDQSVLADKLIDRILGCIYGNCLGDAVGLGKIKQIQ